MENWSREEWFDETSLPWVLPSPNLPTPESATVYPGQVIIEGTNLSEGRGTTKPFEFFGAPWIDGFVLSKKLNELNLPGVKFREVSFTPTFSKFSGQQCGGCQLHIIDRDGLSAHRHDAFDFVRHQKGSTATNWNFTPNILTRCWGLRACGKLWNGASRWTKLSPAFQPGLNEFAKLRAPYLLYH